MKLRHTSSLAVEIQTILSSMLDRQITLVGNSCLCDDDSVVEGAYL